MNEWQKELVKVAGDMVASKERVKKRVFQQHDIKPKKPIRFALLTTIVTLCFFGFIIVQLLNKETKQSANLFNDTQLAHFENTMRIYWGEQDEEFYTEEAYEKYKKLMATYYYAQSLGLQYSEAELEATRKEHYDNLTMLKQLPEYADLFKEKGIKKYFKTYIEPLLPMYTAKKKLGTFYLDKYPTFPNGLVQQIAAEDALRYFNKHFAEQAKAFQEQQGIKNSSSSSHGIMYIGTVIKVESNAFLFVEGAIPEDLEILTQAQIMKKYQNATWYPVVDDFPVKKGDYVRLDSKSNESIEEGGKVTHYGSLNNVEIFDPTVTTKLNIQNEQEVIQFFHQTEWQPPEDMKDPPDYTFMLEGVRVDVWNSYGQSLYVHKLEYGAVHFSQKKSQELKAILGIEES
ncbi:hypothetical protein [Lysinibacillus sp. G4S2]|uniref:hypothetical protein n=1 Tax=Lysinibacillus sp. G4S2 TaxID=3055859 RepID=UPI0025A2C5A7|nr:hypothetical protein [Lysinibacillus sp. G4S2]MDM5247772.1 hypothetical protein [Lysinibacillus sp. G4S2]